MSAAKDKTTGNLNEAAGKMKEKIGQSVGSEKLQADGLAQQAKGNAQQALGNAKEAVGNAVNKAAEKINRAAD